MMHESQLRKHVNKTALYTLSWKVCEWVILTFMTNSAFHYTFVPCWFWCYLYWFGSCMLPFPNAAEGNITNPHSIESATTTLPQCVFCAFNITFKLITFRFVNKLPFSVQSCAREKKLQLSLQNLKLPMFAVTVSSWTVHCFYGLWNC